MNQSSGRPLKRTSSQTELSVDEPSATRRKMSLEVVPNLLTDATHARLDGEVIRVTEDPPWCSILPIMLLATIVSTSEGLLNPKYGNNPNASALLHDQPDLVEKLRLAWKDKSFKEIRNLGLLRINKHSSSFEGMGVPAENKDAVIKAWKSKYIGRAHLALLDAIDRLHTLEEKTNYAKILTITQSSGTGKSRAVDAMSEKRIVLPLCLREDLGRDSFAYPPPDARVRHFLLGTPSAQMEKECKSYLRSFLCSLFDSVREYAEKNFGTKKMTYSSMVMEFYNLFMDTAKRNEFYATVIAKGISTSMTTSMGTDLSFQGAQKTLMEHCSDWPSKKHCPIIISMDEVHVLFNARPQDRLPYTLYSRFISVVNELVLRDFCVLFLSTVSSVASLAPSKAVANSLREGSDDRILPAPYTELSFDVHIIADPLASGKATLASVGSFACTAKFGRPMFYAAYISRISEKREPLVKIGLDIMRIVRTKLSGRNELDSPAILDTSSIAILSARLLLDLSPSASMARKYEEELVRSHLRMLYSVHENQETIVTGSSPEPLIAEASAELMHSSVIINGKETPFMEVWKLLVQFVERGLLPQGTIGQLLGRVFSIFAMDRAIEGTSTKRELKYQTPVTVAEYYQALLTDEAWKILKDSTPANCSSLTEESREKRFEDVFADAYFHFSHYGKANDETPLQDCYGWALWLRGTAILCQLNQTRTDRALPIFFSKPTGTLSAQSTSMALDQDKTGQKEDPGTIAIQSAENIGLFTQGQKLPYIAAVHCYALTEDEGINTSHPNTYALQSPKKDEAAPRYQIDFRGLAAYRNITESMKSDVRRMIDGTKTRLFTHHPRPGNLDLVRQMLPLLNGDSSTTAWFRGLDKPLSGAAGGVPSQGSGAGEGSGGPSVRNKKLKNKKQ